MISHAHKCIFIHIPKCAGTSIEKVLGHFDTYGGRGGQDHRTLRQIQPKVDLHTFEHSVENYLAYARRLKKQVSPSRYKNPRNAITVSASEFKHYYKFTVIRNPWTRVFSAYRNIIEDPIHRIRYQVSGNVSFESFLPRYIGKRLFFKPQLYYLKDFSGQLNLDFICRFESLAEDFKIVRDELGLGPCCLPHENKGASPNIREHYSPQLIDLVARVYHQEIKLFKYEPEL